VNFSDRGKLLPEEPCECKRTVKDDAGLAQLVRLQKLSKDLGNRLAKSASVPCPPDGLRALGRWRHKCKYSGWVPCALNVLHDVLAPVSLDVQTNHDIRTSLTAIDHFHLEIIWILSGSVRPPVLFRERLGYLKCPAADCGENGSQRHSCAQRALAPKPHEPLLPLRQQFFLY